MINCPICLVSVEHPDFFLFQCVSRRCADSPEPNPLRSAWLELDVKTPSVTRVVAAKGARMPPSGVPCRVCSEPTTLALCPHCGNELPESWRSSAPIASVAVLGARGSGKSTFVAVALKMLADVLLGPSGWVVRHAFDLTDDVYRRRYWEPLVNGSALTPTRPVAQDRMIRYPLTYEVRRGSGHRYEAAYLSVFDVAGEDLQTREGVRAAGRFLPAVDQIVFLVDPLQFQSVRLAAHGVMSLPGEAVSPEGVLGNIVGRLRAALELVASEPIRIPITIAVAKFDALMRLSNDPDSSLHNLVRTGAAVTRDPAAGPVPFSGDLADDRQLVDAETRSLLDCLDAQQFLSTVEHEFATSRFTVLSALGYSPVDGSLLRPSWVLPHRVADPFAEVLATHGVRPGAPR